MAGQARILSQAEIRNLFQILRNSRDQTLFALGIYSGLRIGEIIAIKQSQVYTTSGGVKNALKVVRQKTTQTLYSDIPIHPKLRDQLSKYREDVPKGTWLFPSDSAAGHLGRCRAHLILRNVDGLRLDDASTHSMRTCLTNMSRLGVPLRTIQEISGHSALPNFKSTWRSTQRISTKRLIYSDTDFYLNCQ
jgi:integrase/recombinase XerD